MCREEHLNYLRVREWQDFESQLRRSPSRSASSRGRPAEGPDQDGHPRGAASGLLSHIGLRDPDRRDYLGARGTRFAIFPGCGLFKSQPDLVMAAELVETCRLWGAAERRDRPAVGRAARRRPGEAAVVRAALVEQARVRDGPRARHAVRRPAGRRPRRTPRQARARRSRASCSSGTHWCRGSGTSGTGSCRPTSDCSRRPRSSSTALAGAGSSSTRRRCSTSTTPGCRPRSSPAPTSTAGGSRSAGPGPTC